MSAIVLQVKRDKNGKPMCIATAIGPFLTFRDADEFATELARKDDSYIYSVLSLIKPAERELL